MLYFLLLGAGAPFPETGVTDEFSEKYLTRSLPAYPGGVRLVWGWIVGWMIVTIAILTIAPALKRKNLLIYATVFVVVGYSITNGIVSTGWESSSVKLTSATYTAATGREVNGTLGMTIGLRGFNVSLIGDPLMQYDEQILYNESFRWAWRHRILRAAFEHAIENGVPFPILAVAEAMVIDAEYIRWGRHYRIAGYYCFTFLWVSFSFLFMSLFYQLWGNKSSKRMSAFMILAAGISNVVALTIWLSVKPYDFEVPFAKDVVIRPRFDRTFYTTLVGTVIAIVYATYILLMGRQPLLVDKTIKSNRSDSIQLPTPSSLLDSNTKKSSVRTEYTVKNNPLRQRIPTKSSK